MQTFELLATKIRKFMSKFNIPNYKTYDTSQGFGNTNEWANSFDTKVNPKKEITVEKPLYQIELENCKTRKELKIVYRKFSKILHPDKGGNTTDMQILNDVYSNLFLTLTD